MRQYELTYLISDNVVESDLNKVTGKVCGYVTSLGGKVLKEEIWGRRKLAYPIKKQDFATYVTLNFEMPALKAQDFEKNIFLTGKIVRHLMIVTNYGKEELTVSKDEIVGTEAIAEVVGGERSFEAIEGETEESKSLMAKREGLEEEKEEEVKAVEEKTEEVTEEVKEPSAAKTTEKKAAKESKEEAPAEDKTAKAEKPAKKTAKAKKETKEEAKPEEKKNDEADRLSKLDKELGDILGDDL